LLNAGFLLTPPPVRLCVEHRRGHSRAIVYQKMPQMVDLGIAMVSVTFDQIIQTVLAKPMEFYSQDSL
jgi:hypothetical protein